MSAEQRALDRTVPADDRPRQLRFDTAIEPSSHRRKHRSPLAGSPQPSSLPARIERARLSARIAALERALETSERRRQAIIEQYERLLVDRNETDESTAAVSKSASRSLLARLIDR